MLTDQAYTIILVTSAALITSACGGSGGGPAAEESPPTAAEMREDRPALDMDGLVVHLPFDGDTADWSGQENHATVYGGEPDFDRFGYAAGAYRLDGLAQYVSLESTVLSATPGDFAVAMWVQTRMDEVGTLAFIGRINGDATWLRYRPVQRQLQALAPGAYKLELETDLSDGAWHHVVFQVKGDEVSLYLDGDFAASTTGGSQLKLSEAPPVFGRMGEQGGPASQAHFSGLLDEISMFTRALSPAEVDTLFRAGPGLPPTANAGGDQLVYFGEVKLNGEKSFDADGELVRYVWDLGDGTQKEGAQVTHTYAVSGMYEVTLTVTDNEGHQASDTLMVEVVEMSADWPAEWSQKEIEMLAEVNEARSKPANCGGDMFSPAAPLELDMVLSAAARLHSLDMGRQDYFEHEGLDGRQPADRIRDIGFDGPQPWGENIAAGSSTAADAMEGLMNSPGHCRNIMNPAYGAIGFGYAYESTSHFGHYWTQKFAGGPGSK